jgi:GTPase SAR1 family protein
MALNIVLIGNANVGKTYSINTLLNGVPVGHYVPTLGCTIDVCRNINDTMMNVWDIAGDPASMGAEGLDNIREYCQNVNVFIYYPTKRSSQASDIPDAEWYAFMNDCSPNAQIIIFGGNLGAILDTF